MNSTMTLANNLTYDPAKNLTSLTFGNGLTPSWTYDANNRIKTISAPNIISLSYTFDPVGNITAIADQLDSAKSKSYAYDPLDRLSTAVGPWGSLSWTYNANGNRLTQRNGINYSYSYTANRLVSVSNGQTSYYSYDNNGNTISDGQKEFIYNQNSRFIKAIEGGKTLGEYTYNGKGERVVKKTGPASTNSASSQNTVYHYDLSGTLIEETDGNGKLITDYIYLNGQPLAMIRKQAGGEETFYYHNDHLGTPKVMTDKLKKVVWNVEFDPFGNEVTANGRKGSYIRSVENNLRFPGQYYDEETGQHYNYFRDYNPKIGRYIEADPLGIGHGVRHLYVYSSNNAVNRSDPYGLQDANTWTYGEIGEWAITSIRPRNFTPPSGLADCKVSIGAACSRGNPCKSVNGSTATAPEDQAAWRNIVNATGGADRSGGGNFMCVGTQNCWFVHSCYKCCGGQRVLQARSTSLALTGSATATGKGTLYFYRDDLMGWCSRADYNSGCR